MSESKHSQVDDSKERSSGFNWRALAQSSNKRQRINNNDEKGGENQPESEGWAEAKEGDLHFPRVHRRQWEDGYYMDVPASSETSVLDPTRPKLFQSAADMEKFLLPYGELEPPIEAKQAASQDEGASERKGEKRDESEREGIGVGMEYDEEYEDVVIALHKCKLSDWNNDADKKYTSKFAPGYRSQKDRQKAAEDITLADAIDELQLCHNSAEVARQPLFVSREDLYINNPVSRVPAGERRFNAIFKAGYGVAEANDGPMSTMQQSYYEMNLTACAPLIHGVDWFVCKEDFLARHGLKRIHFLVAALTPRQFGKTTVVAIVATALALFMTKIEIAIFAVGLDAAKRMLQKIKDFFRRYLGSGAEQRIGIDKSEEISIVSESDSITAVTAADRRNCADKVTIKSLPAAKKGTRITPVNQQQTTVNRPFRAL